HFVDTIKMIAYRAETSLASLLREHLVRSDDARALLRHIFHNEVDLLPDLKTNTLTVRLHHLTHAAHDQPVAQLCAALNETQTVFPGTHLTLIFEIGSSEIHRDQEVSICSLNRGGRLRDGKNQWTLPLSFPAPIGGGYFGCGIQTNVHVFCFSLRDEKPR